METINLPTSEAPAEIRESIRAVLHSHMFVVACEPSTGFAGLADGQPLLAALAPDRFEALLVELGNNAMQRMHMLAINAVLDAEAAEDNARLASPPAFVGTVDELVREIERKPKRVALDDIKWEDATRFAAIIARICGQDIGFDAPEMYGERLREVAELMDGITAALHLTKPLDRVEENDWSPHVRELQRYVDTGREDWTAALRVVARMTAQIAARLADTQDRQVSP